MISHRQRLARLGALADACKATALILEALYIDSSSKRDFPVHPGFVGSCVHSFEFRPNALPEELAREAQLDTIHTLGEAYQKAQKYASSFHKEVVRAIKRVRKQPSTGKELEQAFKQKTMVLVGAFLGVVISHDKNADTCLELVHVIQLFTEIWRDLRTGRYPGSALSHSSPQLLPILTSTFSLTPSSG